MSKLTSNSPEDDILERVHPVFRAEPSPDVRQSIAANVQELRRYDILAMDRVAAILMLGRSGSVLLASYLDGHDDVIMIAEDRSQLLYPFFDQYRSMPWRDKLIAYTAFLPHHTRYFEGDFGISPERYYAAVLAIIQVYADWPAEFLESSRAFFLFVHIAYNLAIGRKLVGSHPMIVYAQHVWDNALATRLVQDFPQAKFIHTIRDPISSCAGVFRYHLQFVENHIQLPYMAVDLLATGDRPHDGMDSRTWTVRFEDLHCDLARTMRDLADWLGLPYQATLIDSTFNQIPYVVKRDGKVWSGPRAEQAERHSWDLAPKDQALLFALFYENFVAWNYPCPRIYRNPLVRCAVVLSLALIPLKIEVIAARAVFKRRALPALRKGDIWLAVKSMLGSGFCRLRIMRYSVAVVFKRCTGATILLHVARPSDHREDRVLAVKSEMKLT